MVYTPCFEEIYSNIRNQSGCFCEMSFLKARLYCSVNGALMFDSVIVIIMYIRLPLCIFVRTIISFQLIAFSSYLKVMFVVIRLEVLLA